MCGVEALRLKAGMSVLAVDHEQPLQYLPPPLVLGTTEMPCCNIAVSRPEKPPFNKKFDALMLLGAQ